MVKIYGMSLLVSVIWPASCLLQCNIFFKKDIASIMKMILHCVTTVSRLFKYALIRILLDRSSSVQYWAQYENHDITLTNTVKYCTWSKIVIGSGLFPLEIYPGDNPWSPSFFNNVSGHTLVVSDVVSWPDRGKHSEVQKGIRKKTPLFKKYEDILHAIFHFRQNQDPQNLSSRVS